MSPKMSLKLPNTFWLTAALLALVLLVFGWQLEDMNQTLWENTQRTIEVERIVINQIQREHPDAVIMAPDTISINWDLIEAQMDSL